MKKTIHRNFLLHLALLLSRYSHDRVELVTGTNMDAPDLGPIKEYIPIPDAFWSFADEGPFEKCTACGKSLLDDGTLYLVEKAFKNSEVVFEYALCIDCHLGLRDELFQKSLQLIGHYFDEHVNLVERREKLIQDFEAGPAPWIENCLITGKPIDECEEYQIMTLCDGRDLLFTYIPCMISGQAMEDIQQILSRKTRERLDAFVEDYLGVPPEAKLPRPYLA